MLVITCIVTYLAIAAILLLVFRGLTRRNKLVDRMLGPAMKVRRPRRRRREQVPNDGPAEEREYIDTR